MISISDNTAADHLLRKVGRDKVEEYMGRLNEGAERSRPFLTTQEMFTIKLNKDKSLVDRYAAANEDKRRAMLAEGGEATKGLDVFRAAEWKLPIQIDNVEWFATAPECCQVMADLRRLEQLPGMEPMSKALRINPGMPFDKEVWRERGLSRSGSEPRGGHEPHLSPSSRKGLPLVRTFLPSAGDDSGKRPRRSQAGRTRCWYGCRHPRKGRRQRKLPKEDAPPPAKAPR